MDTYLCAFKPKDEDVHPGVTIGRYGMPIEAVNSREACLAFAKKYASNAVVRFEESDPFTVYAHLGADATSNRTSIHAYTLTVSIVCRSTCEVVGIYDCQGE